MSDGGASGTRGAADRVAAAHHQARRGLAVAASFAVAAPVAAVVPHSTGAWLPLHLFLVGGLLGAIATATQLLAVTWSSAPAPAPGLASLPRWALGAGAVGIAAGRELEVDAVTAVGGSALLLGLALVVVNLVGIRRGAVTDRFQPAVDAYLLAVGFGLAGVAAGVVLATAAPGSWWDEVRSAHVAVNVFGLVGIVIAATLPFFVATQARMKMSPRATPARLRAVSAGLGAATGATAAGHLLDRPGLAAAGLGAYAAGIVATAALLPPVGRRQLAWAGPRLVQLGAGIAWWALTTVLLAVAVLGERTGEDRILQAMVVGGFAQILLASLSYFGPVLRGGGHRRLTAGFATTRPVASLAGANVAAAAALAGAEVVLAAGLAVWVADVAVRAARLLTAGPPAAE